MRDLIVPLILVVLLVALIGYIFYSTNTKERRYVEFAARCEQAGGTAIRSYQGGVCVEKFADMSEGVSRLASGDK